MRQALRVGAAATAELYANTDIDELVLSACIAQLAEAGPLSASDETAVASLDRQLNARPGVAARLLASASDGA